MTTVEYSAIQNMTDAPVAVPYRYGLFSVVSFNSLAAHDRAGMQWQSDSCADAGIAVNPCQVTADDLAAGLCSHVGSAAPFSVYVYNTDSLAGQSLEVHEASTRQRLIMAEQAAVEAEVYSMLNDAATTLTAPTGTTAAEKYANALASVEGALPGVTGAEGVIYMSRFGASLLASELDQSGGMLRTKLGTPVAAMGGWPDDEHTVFGTGPVKGARGDLEVYQGTAGAELASNDVSIIAERAYAFGWDCGAVGAAVTL